MIHIATNFSELSLNNLTRMLPKESFTFHDFAEVLSNRLLAAKCHGLLISIYPQVDSNLIADFHNLKFVATPTTGLTHIDTELLEKMNIEILSLKNFTSQLSEVTSTPELAWGLLISIWRKIALASRAYQLNSDLKIRNEFSSLQLSGKTIGIIGFGRIGRQISKYAAAFNMNVIFYDPYVNNLQDFKGVSKILELEDLLTQSDVICISASVLDEDLSKYPIINSRNIYYLKKGAAIVNIARGIFIDEEVVAQALRNGNISGVAVDVLQREELLFKGNHESELEILRDAGFNVLITPHIGGICEDAFEIALTVIAKQIIDFSTKGI